MGGIHWKAGGRCASGRLCGLWLSGCCGGVEALELAMIENATANTNAIMILEDIVAKSMNVHCSCTF